MNSFVLSPKRPDSEQSTPETPPIDRNSALQELDRILASRYFKSADRSKQFLKFVVLNKLDGTLERLKSGPSGLRYFTVQLVMPPAKIPSYGSRQARYAGAWSSITPNCPHLPHCGLNCR